jgi:hypothetical protein
MRSSRTACVGRLGALLALGLVFFGLASQPARVAAGVDAKGLTSLGVVPSRALLRGPDSVQQLAVDGVAPDASRRDLTLSASFVSSNPEVASVDRAGLITARGDGTATVTVRSGSLEATVPVHVKDFASGLPVNFANQVVPIFSKLGCNSGGCHGKSGGQNGFRLSLLGFDPALDYETLVKEGRGRRLFPAAPERSLLLTKATAKVPHGGGRKMEAGSHEYRVVSRWIAAGMPVGRASDPSVARIEIFPDARVMPRGTKQQIVVTAHYTDGGTEDVTRWAQYQSNDNEVA